MFRPLVATSGALAMLAIIAATCSAYEYIQEPAGSVSIVSSGKVTFGEGFTSVECNLTMNGTFSEGPIPLASGATAGEIRRFEWSACEGGEIAAILELPWPIKLKAILGTAPNALTGYAFEFVDIGFQLEGFIGVECLYGSASVNEGPAFRQELLATATPGVYTTGILRALSEKQLPLQEGSFLCPETGSFHGTGAITPTQRITVS